MYLSPWPPTSSKSVRATHTPHLKNLSATHQTLSHSPSEVLETKQCRTRRSYLCMLHPTVRRRSSLPKDLQKDLPTEPARREAANPDANTTDTEGEIACQEHHRTPGKLCTSDYTEGEASTPKLDLIQTHSFHIFTLLFVKTHESCKKVSA